MDKFITADADINDALLKLIAHIPTQSLSRVADPALFKRFEDEHYMRIAYYLAEKSYDEGGCPIGAVIKDNDSGLIAGKGHNTLVQESHPYNHGETSAIRDAGRINFAETTIYTSLSPCNVCTELVKERGFPRVVIGDSSNVDNKANEDKLREHGLQVDSLEDPKALTLYGRFAKEKPEQNMEDWKGLAALGK